MLLVAVKTLLTPLLLALCTVVSHRWGDVVGGWMLGLPMVSGPVSLFLMLQHGSLFAESAARASLLGFAACGVFCLAYLALADRLSWKLSLAGSAAACVVSIGALSLVHLSLAETVLAVALVLLTINALLGGPKTSRRASMPSLGGVAGRMALSGAVVLAITTFSGLLGGTLSGLLAPLPVLGALMSSSAHRREGADAVQGMLRGLLVGLWGGVAFFAAVAFLLSVAAPLTTYSLAIVVAALTGWVATKVAAWRPTLRLEQHFHDAALGRVLHRLDRVRERVSLGDQRGGIDVATLEQAYRGGERAAA